MQLVATYSVNFPGYSQSFDIPVHLQDTFTTPFQNYEKIGDLPGV